MAIDVKELIEKAVELLTKDENLMESFKKEPIKTIEKLLNIDLPDEALESIVKGVKPRSIWTRSATYWVNWAACLVNNLVLKGRCMRPFFKGAL